MEQEGAARKALCSLRQAPGGDASSVTSQAGLDGGESGDRIMAWLVESLRTLLVGYGVPRKLSANQLALRRDRAYPRGVIVVVNRLGGI